MPPRSPCETCCEPARHKLVFLHHSPFATAEAFSAPSIGIRLPYRASDTAEPTGPVTAALRRLDRPGPDDAKCGAMLAEPCPAGAGRAELSDTRDADRRRRLMAALVAIHRRIGRHTALDAGTGIHRDWQAFASPAMWILPELSLYDLGARLPPAPSQVWPNGYDSWAAVWNRA
jgi:hypothetical protein